MKVLNVNCTLDPVGGGGAAERTFQMSRALAKAGIPCTVLTLDVGLIPERIQELEGTRVIALHCLFKRFYIPALSYALVQKALEEADIVHLMGHWSLLNALVYFLVRRLHKPYVVCAAGTLPIYGRSKSLKRCYNWIVGRRIIQNANACIAITGDERSHFETYGVEASQVVVIPNGINPDNYPESDGAEFRSKYGLGDYPFILFVGRLNSIKGPDLLLRAFCKVKDGFQVHRMVFAGPDEGMLSELREIAAAHGISDRVLFTGYLGGVAKSQAFHASELVVIPSRQEAMSIVVLEAGIAGKPVLITDRCGFDEIASRGGGQVVPASVDGLQRGLAEILRDQAKLNAMGTNLRKYTLEHFDWDSIVHRYLELYTRILRSG